MPVPSIFDFDETELLTYEPEKVSQALRDHPALYVNHLRLAEHLTRWANQVGVGAERGSQMYGFCDALHDVAAHLRQADYTPGGELD